MSIEFPKKGEKIDIVAYYRLSTTEQRQAKTWLEVNGTEQEKAAFSKIEDAAQKRFAEQAEQDRVQAELRANMREAPNKHGKKKKPGSGSCNIQ